MKIRVLWPGKTKHAHFRSAIDDYAGRIRKFLPFEIVETKEHSASDKGRQRRIKKESKGLQRSSGKTLTVVLDSTGKQFSSEEFAHWLERQTNDIDFLIGGPAGLRVDHSDLKLSIGKWTIAHDLARVVLLEQLYRALTILKNIPYHK